MNKTAMVKLAGGLCALAVLAGCAGPAAPQASESASPSPTATATPRPSPTAAPTPSPSPTPTPTPSPSPAPSARPGQGELFSALAGESVMGLVLLAPTQEELALAGEVEQVFPTQQYGEWMLILPRLPDSTVIIQQLSHDQDGMLTGAQEIWRSRNQPAAVLLQQDIPEGYATLRVVIQRGEQTGTYDVNYYGKGDGRRDFYVWLDRAP